MTADPGPGGWGLDSPPANGDALSLVLGKLAGVRKRAGYWTALCPAHDDTEPSLTVGRGTSQPVVLKCHRGCAQDDVIAALGLSPAAICAATDPAPRRQVTAEYPYTDEDGRTLFVKVRMFPKSFYIKRPGEHAGWVNGIGDAPRVLYRLPAILAAGPADVIWIAEGEKDCDALGRAGEIATCNFDGAGKWRAAYSEVLAGRDILIVADKDAQGYAHARQVAASLNGHVRSCWIVEAAAGKDAADHLAAGRAVTDFVWWS